MATGGPPGGDDIHRLVTHQISKDNLWTNFLLIFKADMRPARQGCEGWGGRGSYRGFLRERR